MGEKQEHCPLSPICSSDVTSFDGAGLYVSTERINDHANNFLILGFEVKGSLAKSKSRTRIQSFYPSGMFFDYSVFYELEKNTIIGIGKLEFVFHLFISGVRFGDRIL